MNSSPGTAPHPPAPQLRIPLSRPDISDRDVERVTRVLRSGTLSLGPAVQEFEERFAEYCGARFAVAVSSGTAALHLCMMAFELQPGDEVVTSPFSFVASANCALMVGAVPVFVDIDRDTWNLNPAGIRRALSQRTRVILPVHVFGQPARMDRIQDLALQEGLLVLEDACEALGATFNEQRVGTFGEAAAFGFYPNKQMTTGEGGMVVTNQETIADAVRSLRNQGRAPISDWMAHDRMGYNYRLSDLHAALGCSQLERIDLLLQRRAQVAGWYHERLKTVPGLVQQQLSPQASTSWFVFVVRLADDRNREDRDSVLAHLRSRGIGCSHYFPPIHLHPFYRERFGYRAGEFPNCEHVADRTLALPFHSNLTEGEVDEVCAVLTSQL